MGMGWNTRRHPGSSALFQPLHNPTPLENAPNCYPLQGHLEHFCRMRHCITKCSGHIKPPSRRTVKGKEHQVILSLPWFKTSTAARARSRWHLNLTWASFRNDLRRSKRCSVCSSSTDSLNCNNCQISLSTTFLLKLMYCTTRLYYYLPNKYIMNMK